MGFRNLRTRLPSAVVQPCSPTLLIVLAVVSCLFILVSSVDDASKGDAESVISLLTDSNFHSTISKGLWIVKFVAPWCGHCERLNPEYDRAATLARSDSSTSSTVQFASVDITENTKIPRKFGVNAFPTIKLFFHGRYIKDYKGRRSSSDLLEFAKSVASFSIYASPWSPAIMSEIIDKLPDFALPSSPSETDKLSAFILRCGGNCRDALSNFGAVAIEFSDFSYFFHLQIEPEEPEPLSTVVIAVSAKNKDQEEPLVEMKQLDFKSLREFISQHQWPGVASVDYKRFYGLKENARLSRAFGVVLLAIDPSKPEYQSWIRGAEKAAKNSALSSQFRFGWVDATTRFGQEIVGLGIKELPGVIVMGSRRAGALWASTELNVTELENGLFGVLAGSIQPIEPGEDEPGFVAGIRRGWSLLWAFIFHSRWHLAGVLGFLLANVGIVVLGWFSFVSDRGRKDEGPDLLSHHVDQSVSCSENGTEYEYLAAPDDEFSGSFSNDGPDGSTALRHRGASKQEEKENKQIDNSIRTGDRKNM